MRAKHLPELLVPALPDQVQVDIAEGGEIAVRIVGGDGESGISHLEPVIGHLGLRQHASKYAFVLVLEVDAPTPGQDRDPFRPRPENPDSHAAVIRMGSEDNVRIVVSSLDE
jgi:hypothetical protein